MWMGFLKLIVPLAVKRNAERAEELLVSPVVRTTTVKIVTIRSRNNN